MGEHFPFTLAAGVSRRYQGYGRLGTAMQEAMDALGEKFYHSDRSLLFQSEAPAQTGNLSIFKSFNFEELQLHIHSGEREEGLQIFREFFRQLREEQAPEAVSKLVHMAKEHIQQNYTSSNLSLKKIAAAVFAGAGLCQFTCSKRRWGLSVTEYITDLPDAAGGGADPLPAGQQPYRHFRAGGVYGSVLLQPVLQAVLRCDAVEVPLQSCPAGAGGG